MFLLGASCGGCPSPKRHPACTLGLLWGLRVYSGLVDRTAYQSHSGKHIAIMFSKQDFTCHLFLPNAQNLFEPIKWFLLSCVPFWKSQPQSSTCLKKAVNFPSWKSIAWGIYRKYLSLGVRLSKSQMVFFTVSSLVPRSSRVSKTISRDSTGTGCPFSSCPNRNPGEGRFLKTSIQKSELFSVCEMMNNLWDIKGQTWSFLKTAHQDGHP